MSQIIPVTTRTTVGELRQLLGAGRSITAIRKRGSMRLVIHNRPAVLPATQH